MRVREIVEDFLEHLQRDEEAVQRVFGQLVSPREDLVEQHALAFEIAFEQRVREFALVGEVIEEAALGDPDGGDDFLDRGRGKSLGQDGGLCGVEEALAGVARYGRREGGAAEAFRGGHVAILPGFLSRVRGQVALGPERPQSRCRKKARPPAFFSEGSGAALYRIARNEDGGPGNRTAA